MHKNCFFICYFHNSIINLKGNKNIFRIWICIPHRTPRVCDNTICSISWFRNGYYKSYKYHTLLMIVIYRYVNNKSNKLHLWQIDPKMDPNKPGNVIILVPHSVYSKVNDFYGCIDVDDKWMLVTLCWWDNFDIGDIFKKFESDEKSENCHQHLEVVNNTFCIQHPSSTSM